MLSYWQIQLIEIDSLIISTDYRIKIQGSRRNPHVLFEIDRGTYDLLPLQLHGAVLPVTALMFTQGINEVQTQATALCGDELQDTINVASWYGA